MLKKNLFWFGVIAILISSLFILPRGVEAKQTKIELWTFLDPGADHVRGRTLAYVIEEFKAKNPDIEVVCNVMQWQQLSPSLMRAVKAGRVPDLAMLYSPTMPPHCSAGTLTALDSYLARWSKEARADTVILSQSKGKDGTVYGLPWELRVSGMMYRQDILKTAGLKPPESLQELAETAEAVAKDDMTGIALGFSPEAPSIASGWFLTTLVGLGAKVLNEDDTAAFVCPEAERLVQWVYDLVHKHKQALPLNVALLGLEPAQQLFIARKAVFLPSSSQRFKFVRERAKLGDAMKMMSYLTFDKGRPAPALVQSWSVVIPRGAKNPEAAWKFIEHWTSPPIQSYQAKTAGLVPMRHSSLSDPWFEEKDAEIIRWATDYAAKHPLNFSFPENTEMLYDVWARMFGQVLTGKMSAKEGLAWAETEYNQMIR